MPCPGRRGWKQNQMVVAGFRSGIGHPYNLIRNLWAIALALSYSDRSRIPAQQHLHKIMCLVGPKKCVCPLTALRGLRSGIRLSDWLKAGRLCRSWEITFQNTTDQWTVRRGDASISIVPTLKSARHKASRTAAGRPYGDVKKERNSPPWVSVLRNTLELFWLLKLAGSWTSHFAFLQLYCPFLLNKGERTWTNVAYSQIQD